jgi:nitrite reductase/ring-hydroxylating ferredoxin subunit
LINRVVDVIDENRCHRGMKFDPDTLHVVCPWHGWEFNALTGASAGDGRWHLRRFKVIEREGNIYVDC